MKLQFYMYIMFLGSFVALNPTSAVEGVYRSKCPTGAGENVRCGKISVPLDYRSPRGEQLSVWFAVINGTLEGQKEQATIFIPGGPGHSSSLQALPIFSRNSPIAFNQPMVLFDVRGTGLSQSLFCSSQSSFIEFYFSGGNPELVKKCAFELGPRRIHFNSANSARDIEVLRVKLAVSRWNIFGVSYGTQIGTFYASLFPGSARTIVLDSAFPLQGIKRGREHYQATVRSLRTVCERTGICSSQQLLKDLAEVLAALRENPRKALDSADLARILGVLALANSTAAALIDAKKGNYRGLEGLSSSTKSFLATSSENPKNFSVSLFLAVNCVEVDRVWRLEDCECEQLAKYEGIVASATSGDYEPFLAEEWSQATFPEPYCVGWPRLPEGIHREDLLPRPREPIDNQGTPILVLNGELDLGSTVSDALRAVRQFKNARFGLIANAGHVIFQRSSCGVGLIRELVQTGRFPKNLSRCADPFSHPFAP